MLKLIEYILKLGFGYALSLVLIFSIVPLLLTTAFDKDDSPEQDLQLLEIYQPYPQHDLFYLQINKRDGSAYYKDYGGDLKERKPLFQFLRKNNFLKKEEQLSDILPFELSAQQLQSFNRIQYEVEDKKIKTLSINDQTIVFPQNGFGSKVFLVLLAVILGIVGIFGCILMTMALNNAIKSYRQTGVWPDLPNSIESKFNGLKWILNGFKPPDENV